jgi:hypothetical protein
MQEQKKQHRVYLLNVQTIGAQCGYGEGTTKAEAIAAALEIARKRDPEAVYDAGHVLFCGGVNC